MPEPPTPPDFDADSQPADRDVIASCLTGAGRSAVAVVSLQGPDADETLSEFFVPVSPSAFLAGQIRYGRWHRGGCRSRPTDNPSQVFETVVVTPIDDGHFEVHCHGGRAAVDGILADLASRGATVVSPDRLPAAETDALIREARQVLIGCQTRRLAAVAMSQVRGGLRSWADRWLQTLDTASPNAPLSDEQSALLRKQIRRMLTLSGFTMRMTEPLDVVFFGATNVGKSSLVNALLGYERSITFDAPGTTRDVLEAATVIDGLPIRFADTAGIRRINNKDIGSTIETTGMAKARRTIAKADLVVHVSDVKDWTDRHQDWFDKTGIPSPPALRVLKVVNKIDTADLLLEPGKIVDGYLAVSALTGAGIRSLGRSIVDAIVPDFPDPDEPLVLNQRQFDCLTRIPQRPSTNVLRTSLTRLITSAAGVDDAREPG